MSRAEIHYTITDAPQHPEDVEHILHAIGEYQSEQPRTVTQTAEIEQKSEDSVMLRLIRSSLTPRYDHDLLEDAEKMRKGVEAHFPEDDRTRLSTLFAGIDIKDPVEVEKP